MRPPFVARFAGAWPEKWRPGPRALRIALAGVAACALVLLLAFLAPAAVLRGWLAAAFFWSSVPIGALLLLMMIRLVPGVWAVEMEIPTEAASLLLPLAALMLIPVLAGSEPLYAWASSPGETRFRAVYLSEGFFVLRTVAWFALLGLLVALLILRRRWSTPVSCAGLVLFATAGTAIAVDWLMSLDPGFTSAEFGLYAMSIQACVALAAINLAALASGALLRRPEVLGGLLLTAVLLWAYFAFMQFVVIWSSDLPEKIAWYQSRAVTPWGAVFWIVAILHALAFAGLIVPPVLRNRHALMGLSTAVLIAKALESAWLVLPSSGNPAPLASALSAIVAWLGLGALTVVAGAVAFRARVEARAPKPMEEAHA